MIWRSHAGTRTPRSARDSKVKVTALGCHPGPGLETLDAAQLPVLFGNLLQLSADGGLADVAIAGLLEEHLHVFDQGMIVFLEPLQKFLKVVSFKFFRILAHIRWWCDSAMGFKLAPPSPDGTLIKAHKVGDVMVG